MEGQGGPVRCPAGISGCPSAGHQGHRRDLRTVATIAPSFGAIKLEDIRLRSASKSRIAWTPMLDIRSARRPHGNRHLALAALLNATKYVGKPFRNDAWASWGGAGDGHCEAAGASA